MSTAATASAWSGRPTKRACATRARLSLTTQVALLSLIPIVVLGFVLARVLQTQIVQRTLADADQSAQLVARLGVQPWLTPRDLHEGLGAQSIHRLDEQPRTRAVSDLARIKSGARRAGSSTPTTTP